jgi:hypothetical protein
VLWIVRFFGWAENAREVEMDMREMVDKVKRKEPLYGTSSLTPYLQGMAARNSRYSQIMLHAIPWFNFVNHNQVGLPGGRLGGGRGADGEIARCRYTQVLPRGGGGVGGRGERARLGVRAATSYHNHHRHHCRRIYVLVGRGFCRFVVVHLFKITSYKQQTRPSTPKPAL